MEQTIIFKIPSEEKISLQKLAKSQDRNLSQLLRLKIKEILNGANKNDGTNSN